MIGLNIKAANPNHFKKVFENSYFTMFTLLSNELQEVIDGKDYFAKCTSFLKVFDRLQIVKGDEKIVYEYIVMEVDSLHNKVVIQKLHKIDLLSGKQTLFGYDVSTKNIEKKLEELAEQVNNKLAALDVLLEDKIAKALAPYVEDETED
jgi:hypothetical protein